MRTLTTVVACSLLLVAAHTEASDGKLYKWTDENGVVHYGDHVPPRFSKTRTEVLNRQGVTIGVHEGEKTPEQLREEMRLRQLEEEQRAAIAARRAYDRVLIDSYASVDEILQMRQRRLAAVDGQIIFTTHHINQLKGQISSLEEEIGRLRKRQLGKGVAEPVIPQRLTTQLEQSNEALAEHEAILEQQYLDQARIRIKYAEDIERYKRLRGIGDEQSGSS